MSEASGKYIVEIAPGFINAKGMRPSNAGRAHNKMKGEFLGFAQRQNRSMTHAFHTLDLSFDDPVMTTMIYRSRSDAPTFSGVKKQVDEFRRLYLLAWGVPIRGIWKIESTSAGVAHIHEYMDRPGGVAKHVTKSDSNSAKFGHLNGLEFDSWLDLAWQYVTNQTPTELKPRLTSVTQFQSNSQPHLIAQIYFSKENPAKRYQNKLPLGWEDEQLKMMQMWGKHGLTKAPHPKLQVIEFETLEEFEAFKEAARLQTESYEYLDANGAVKTFEAKRFHHGVGNGGYHVGPIDHEKIMREVNGDINDN